MISCIISDDEDDCVMVEVAENPKNPNKPKKTKKILKFERNLIAQVRRHRLLYDNKHKLFSNVAKKESVWQKIAKIFNVDVDICKNTWIELRYAYQCHTRRLHKYFIKGHKTNRKRPVMCFESELMFLWRFIENRKSCSLPFEIIEPSLPEIQTENESVQFGTEDLVNQVIDDDLILVEAPVECIVIDEDEDNGKTEKPFKVTNSLKKLIEQIKKYPELYDSDDIAFKDYTRKSYVWNSIAVSLGDKATKLMKSWIIMQTRYEWEINQPANSPQSPVTDLQKRLEYFKDYMLKNPDTVFKQSFYLKYAWHEPIDYFKEIYNLILRMKKTPDIVFMTDSLLSIPDKGNHYQMMWKELANAKGNTAGQCETTWLIMRHFYWELMYMRQQNYQLTDKWYFETVITELYEISKTSQLAKQKQQEETQQQQVQQQQQQQILQQQHNLADINFTTSNEKPSTSNKRQKSHTNGSNARPKSKGPEMLTQIAPTIVNKIPAPSLISPQQHQGPLPKITGAMSLAPQAFTGAPLQIRPVVMPQTNYPQPPQILNGLNSSMSPIAPASTPTPAVHHTNIQMSLNLPQQTRVSAVSMPTVSSVRSLAPTTIIHAPPPSITVRNFASTNVRNLTPTNVEHIPQASLRNVRAKGNPAALKTPIINTSVSNTSVSNTSVSHTSVSNTSSLTSPLMPLTTMVNMTGNTNNLKTYTTASMNSPQTQIRPIAIAAGKAAITSIHNMSATVANVGANNNINLPVPVATSTPLQPPLPKISGAVSLLNPNEILIELIASHNGNHLVVHGPPLSEKYQLSMSTVAKFIREILAIPLLHNRRHNQPQLINSYWEHISLSFHLPPHICRACWNFLLENFNHFPQIAPLKDLMAPFRTSLNVWKESFSLFKVFDDHCVAMGWLQHMDRLPEVVGCISSYPVLYQDVGKESLLEPNSNMEVLCAWRTLRLRFPKIHDIQDIWVAIKNCFSQYMSDLEFGIDNKWPINWWRSLARLKFLVDARYDTNEPFYYIVSNKMVEEIEKCAMLEMKARYNRNDIPLPKIEPKREDQISIQEEPTVAFEWSAAEPTFRKDVETVALLTAIQKHPVIYGKADYVEKYEAWKKVAKELQMEVPDCLLAFRHATKNYCSYKKQDPVTRCRLNQKYYKKLDEIFRNMSSSSSKTKNYYLNVKTPTELNQSIDSGVDSLSTNSASEFVFPERYISDISMSNSDSNLVVKNWNFALGNLQLDDTFHFKMRDILNKYLPNN